MYRIQATTLSVSSHFPKGLTTLGISWLRGQFDAVALHRGEIVGSWRAPEIVEDPEKFTELLTAAAKHTGFTGDSIHLVLAHPRLTHQLVDIPDARGPALRPLVQRQVERLKVFEEAAAWTFEKSEPTKNSACALVHLLPESLLQRLSDTAKAAGYHLTSVVPSSVVLHTQFAKLPLDGQDVGVIAADINGGTIVVVGRREGPLLLARSLDTARAGGKSSLGVDLNRTLLFVSQQFATSVAGIWLFGPALTERLDELKPQFQIPVQASPEPSVPQYWAQEALRVPAEFTANLVSTQQQRAPQRKALLHVTTLLIGIAVLGMAAAAAAFQFLARRENAVVDQLKTQIIQVQSQHQEHQKHYLELANRARLVEGVLDARPGAVPLWFLAYLGQAAPDALTVTNVHILRSTNAWRVRVTGRVQPSHDASPASVTRVAEEFSERLRTGPFQATIVPPTPANNPPVTTAANVTASAFATWAARAKPQAPPPRLGPPDGSITIEALLQ